jgi:hypothetical protein
LASLFIVVLVLELDLGFILIWFDSIPVVRGMLGEVLRISLAKSAVPRSYSFGGVAMVRAGCSEKDGGGDVRLQ